MTAAPEIPADVMAAAERAARSSVERPYNKGTVSRASSVIARAILAERQRAAGIADAMSIPFAAGRPRAEAHNAACRAISHVITGAST